MVDMAVVDQAYRTAVSLRASAKVMLALFEAALVESNFENLHYGDRDSQGFLQQRPSAGWGTVAQVTNVAYATTSFVKRAQAIESRYSSASSLAQAVQISAFPGRYALTRARAEGLIAQAKSRTGLSSPGGTTTASGIGATATAGIPTLGFLSSITAFTDALKNPIMWRRVIMLAVGILLILVAAFKSTGDNKLSPTTKKIAALVVTKGKAL